VAYPEKAANPIPLLVSMCKALSDRVFDTGYQDFSPTNLEFTSIDVGNSVTNIIPYMAKANFNVRFNPTFTGERLIKQIQSICEAAAETYEDLTWEFKYKISGEAFLSRESKLQNIFKEIAKIHTGLDLELSTTGGTSDARFMHTLCPIIEFGLMSDQAHQVDEHVSLDDLQKLSEIYKGVILRYFGLN
jgi:succinyl-diaminopimelate desuccinylase